MQHCSWWDLALEGGSSLTPHPSNDGLASCAHTHASHAKLFMREHILHFTVFTFYILHHPPNPSPWTAYLHLALGNPVTCLVFYQTLRCSSWSSFCLGMWLWLGFLPVTFQYRAKGYPPTKAHHTHRWENTNTPYHGIWRFFFLSNVWQIDKTYDTIGCF